MANLSQIKLPNGTTYDIKDSISGYTTNTGTITQVKTTAGAHTTIDVSSGAATFNVPTKTSHLTNDSEFITASHTSTYSLPTAVYNTLGGIKPAYSTTGTATLTTSSQAYTNSPTIAARTTTSGKYYGVEIDSDGRLFVNVPWTDKQVTTAALTSGTTYYPILATGTGTATRQIDSTLKGLTYKSTAGSTSTAGSAALTLGNDIATGTANNERGQLILYSVNNYYVKLQTEALGANRIITLPNKAGTIAITDDLIDSTVGISSETQAEFSSGFLVSPSTLAEALVQIDDGFLDIWQVATTSRMGMMSNTDKIYLDSLSDAIETTSSTITIKNGSSGGRAFYLETNSSDSDDVSLISAITSLGWDSDVIVS